MHLLHSGCTFTSWAFQSDSQFHQAPGSAPCSAPCSTPFSQVLSANSTLRHQSALSALSATKIRVKLTPAYQTRHSTIRPHGSIWAHRLRHPQWPTGLLSVTLVRSRYVLHPAAGICPSLPTPAACLFQDGRHCIFHPKNIKTTSHPPSNQALILIPLIWTRDRTAFLGTRDTELPSHPSAEIPQKRTYWSNNASLYRPRTHHPVHHPIHPGGELPPCPIRPPHPRPSINVSAGRKGGISLVTHHRHSTTLLQTTSSAYRRPFLTVNAISISH